MGYWWLRARALRFLRQSYVAAQYKISRLRNRLIEYFFCGVSHDLKTTWIKFGEEGDIFALYLCLRCNKDFMWKWNPSTGQEASIVKEKDWAEGAHSDPEVLTFLGGN